MTDCKRETAAYAATDGRLKVTPFERYMLDDGSSDYPMTAYVRILFQGALDRGAVREAFKLALQRHPLLRATIEDAEGAPNWRVHQIDSPDVVWVDEPDSVWPEARIDLTREAGPRVRIGQRAGQSEMVIAFHHSCCDGMGIARFVEDVLLVYDAAVRLGDARRAVLPDLPAEHLDRRLRLGRSRLSWLIRTPLDLLGMLISAEFMLGRPAALERRRPSSDDAYENDNGPLVAGMAAYLTRRETAALRAAARSAKCTLNDLIVRDVFLTAQQWLEEHGEGYENRPLRVMVPVNLRTAAHATMPAANVVGMVNLDRHVYRWKNQRQLLSRIHLEMLCIRRLRVGIVMNRLLAAVRRLWGDVRPMFPRDRCVATCVLSNMGAPLRQSPLADEDGRLTAGGAGIEEIEFYGPVRPFTHAALVVTMYAGRLGVTLRYNRNAVGDDGAEALMRGLLEALRRSASAV